MQKNPTPSPIEPQKNADPAGIRPVRPDDVGSIYVGATVKIFDPETQEVFVETRA